MDVGVFRDALQMAGQRVMAVCLGGPVIILIITILHLCLRTFLLPFLGKIFSSLAALLLILIFVLPHAKSPEDVYGFLSWSVNLLFVLGNEAFRRFCRGVGS